MQKIKYLIDENLVSKKIKEDIKKFVSIEKNNQASILPDIHMKKGEMSPTGSILLSKKIIPSYTHLSIGSGISTWTFEVEKGFEVENFEKLFKHLQFKIPGLNLEKKKISDFTKKDIIQSCEIGAKYLVKKKLLSKNSLKNIEMNGDFNKEKIKKYKVNDVLPDYILKKCYENFGCLGTGNTFIELHKIVSNYEKKQNLNKYFIFIHSGLAETYLTKFYSPRWGLHGKKFLSFEKEKWDFFSKHIVDKESIELKKNYFPNSSKYFSLESNGYDGQIYLSAMNYLCNISTVNRLHHGIIIKNYLKKNFNIKNFKLVLDNTHDSIKKEKYKGESFYFHRHGASPVYQKKNKSLFVIPSKPGGETFIGKIEDGIEKYHNSICHGTGRKFDRPKSIGKFTNDQATKKINQSSAKLFYKMKKISGEHPDSFKDLDEVLNSLKKKIKFKKLYNTKPIYILKS